MKRVAITILLLSAVAVTALAEVTPVPTGGFSVSQKVTVAVSPEQAFDYFTGDVIDWWDHTFSGNPVKLYLEPKPGGGFWEIFDDAGNGARHAEVIYVKRGEVIRFDGPLGLSGNALHMSHTVTFARKGDETEVSVVVNAAGQVEDGWQDAVDGVWTHFLSRYRDYVVAQKK